MSKNLPRSYSTVINGKIVWVDPGEAKPSRKVRTHRETDHEIRDRLKRRYPNGDWSKTHGDDLDFALQYWGLPERKLIEEEV